jgi:cell division protein FtsQ
VTKAQVMEIMGADIGRNIFFIPLAQQKAQLEQIPWVDSASVMRFVPNRLQVEIHERTPVAFARVGPRIFLIDAGGTLMDLPPKHKYSFPVILGMNPGEPLSTRVPRMRAYNQLVHDLDAGGASYSKDLSEIDVSDLENLKVRVNDPQGDVLVELGASDFLKRYQTYVGHVQEWRQQFQKLESVNLRYDNQVIVNPDMEGKPRPANLTAASAKAAAAAGVKPAALITHINPHDRSIPKPVFELSEKKVEPKSATAKKTAAKPKSRRVLAKASSPSARKPVAKHPVAPKPNAAHASTNGTAPKPGHATRVTANAVSPKPSPAVAKPSAGSN